MREQVRRALYLRAQRALPEDITIFYENITKPVLTSETKWVQMQIIFDETDGSDPHDGDSRFHRGFLHGHIGVPQGSGTAQHDALIAGLEQQLSFKKLNFVRTSKLKTGLPFHRHPHYCMRFSVPFTSFITP